MHVLRRALGWILFLVCVLGVVDALAGHGHSRGHRRRTPVAAVERGGGSVCGDGAIEGAETCDDGNASSGDGCSSACAAESGFTCLGTPSTCIDVGETTIIFNSFETAPAGDPGGWGLYTAFPGCWTPDTSLPVSNIDCCYHRGTAHASETSSHRCVRSTNRGRSWEQVGAELTVNLASTYGEAVRGVRTSRLASGRVAMLFHTLDIDDQTTQPIRSTYYRYSDSWGNWSTPANLDRHNVSAAKRYNAALDTYADETTDINSTAQADVTIAPVASLGYFAIGFTGTFAGIVFDSTGGTAGVAGACTWQYWNGSAWTNLSGVSDATSCFTAAVGANQAVRWTLPSNWATTTIDGSGPYYYVRANITSIYTTIPVSTYAEVQMSFGKGSTFIGNGDFLNPSGTIITAPVSTNNAGETEYFPRLLQTPDSTGAQKSWTQRSLIVDPTGTGRQYEGMSMLVMDNGQWLTLLRVDNGTPTTFRTTSDDAGATWSTLATAWTYTGNHSPSALQLTNGAVLAVTADPTTRLAELRISRDRGVTWLGPVTFMPPFEGETSTDDSEECDLLEVQTNVAGIVCGRERTSNASSGLIYTEVGVGAAAPTSAYRPSEVAFFDASSTTRSINYGSTAWYQGQQQFTAFLWFRREANGGANHHFLSRNGSSQLHQRWLIDSSNRFEVRIASSLTAEAVCNSQVTIQLGVAYYAAIRYLGTCSPATDCDTNAERLRVWLCTNPASCSEATCSYTGTVPAQMTSPNTTALTYVGAHPLSSTQFLRDIRVSSLSIWPVAVAPGDITGSLYNQRVPQGHAEMAAVVGSNATIFIPFDGDYDDDRGTLPAPTVTGPISMSQRWVP